MMQSGEVQEITTHLLPVRCAIFLAKVCYDWLYRHDVFAITVTSNEGAIVVQPLHKSYEILPDGVPAWN